MSASLPNTAVRTHANPDSSRLDDIRRPARPLRSDAKNEAVLPSSGVVRARVREAIRLSGGSQKQFAINCKQPQSVISESLSGSRGLNADWLEVQEQPFKVHYKQLQDADWGIDQQAQDDELEALASRFFSMLFRARRTA